MAKNKYFNFLCNLVSRDSGDTNEHGLLLRQLHRMEYYSLIPNDDNRGEDGKQLRETFLDEVGPTWAPSLSQGPCTVFEMMIGVAHRLHLETEQSRWERPTADWFWILIDNLGLTSCTDANFDIDCVYSRVTDMLDRHYQADGDGGLFPLTDANRDQRKVEIWYQMMAYILENYPM
jgi:hypothetical protein